MFYKFQNNTRLIKQGDYTFIYSIKENNYDLLNEGAKIFLDYFDGNYSSNEITKRIANEYDIESDFVKCDLIKFSNYLRSKKYIAFIENKEPTIIPWEFNDNRIKLLKVQIQITNKCNLNCDYCFAEPNKHKGDLSTNEWINLLNFWHTKGLRVVTLTGGEPFLRHDIFEILDKINNKFIILFNTNASLIDFDFGNKLSKYNISLVQVSLDSLTPEIHDKYRGNGSWERAMAGLINLKKFSIPISISTTFTSSNEKELNDIQSYCQTNEFDFNPDVVSLDNNISISQPNAISQSQINQIKETQDEFSIDTFNVGCQAILGYGNFSNQGLLKPCDLPDSHFNEIHESLLYKSDFKKDFEDTFLYQKCVEANKKILEYGSINKKVKCVNNCDLFYLKEGLINGKII